MDKETINILQKENERLKKELDFMNALFNGEHNSTPVYQIERATKNGKPVWINTHMITIKELKELEQTEQVKALIKDKSYPRYSDKW
tara:strand:- start:23 stop:283 length:261 start_codon:yes stop_codon:yes gene_type:complete